MYFMALCVVNSRPHPRPSSQSASLLPFLSLIYLLSLLLYPLPSYPFSFRTLCPETPRGGGTDSLRQRLQPDSAHLRLFATSFRIPVRMSATISCLTSQR